MLDKLDIDGNPFIGVFCACSDKVAFVPEQVNDIFVEKIASMLDVEVERMSIDGSPLLGSLIVLNSKGAVVADFARPSDIERISKYYDKVERAEDPLNALGNNVLANDNGALVHPDMGEESMDIIRRTLDIPVSRGEIGGIQTVGASGVANNKGVLCHPKSTEAERTKAGQVLGVSPGIGTANFGSPLVGAAVICNSKGGLVGTKTTGVEMHRIEDVLELY